MTKRSKPSGKRTVVLSPTQRQTPDTLPPAELAARRARLRTTGGFNSAQRGYGLLNEGARLLAQGEAAAAVLKLEQAVALLPDNAEAAINLGGAYVLQRRYNKAEKVLEQASRAHPDNPMIWSNLAAAHLGNLALSGPQQQAKAIAAYTRVLELDPVAPNVHYNLGLIYHDRREFQQAHIWFERALTVNPDDQDAHTWLRRLDALNTRADDEDSPRAAAEAS